MKDTLYKTRFTEETGVSFTFIKRVGWIHVWFDPELKRNVYVGPYYVTKIELLCDHENYLIDAGWMKGTVKNFELTKALRSCIESLEINGFDRKDHIPLQLAYDALEKIKKFVCDDCI